MKCPFKFGNYDFEGAEDCIGSECGMHKLCNANDAPPEGTFQVSHDCGSTFSPPVKIQGEQDSRERLNAIRARFGAGPTSMTDEQIEEMSEHYRPKLEADMAIIDELPDEQDSREELEADANGYVVSWWQSGWVYSFDHADSMKRDIMRLLDRQAAITKAKCEESLASKNLGVLCEPRNDDTREALENDAITYCDHFRCTNQRFNEAKLLALLDRQAAITERECLERAAKSDWLGQHLHAVMAENRELQAKLDELTAENAKQRKHVDNLAKELTAVYNALARAEHDNATLRDKLGRMLDNTHEITRIGGDC